MAPPKPSVQTTFILSAMEKKSYEQPPWNHVFENFDLMFAQMNELGITQQQLKVHLDLTNRSVDKYTTEQQDIVKQVEANAQAVAKLNLHSFKAEANSESANSSGNSSVDDVYVEFDNAMVDDNKASIGLDINDWLTYGSAVDITDKLFEDMALRDNVAADVIWDEEFQHVFDSQNLLHQLSQGIQDQLHYKEVTENSDCKVLSLSDSDNHGMLDDMTHWDVVWDDDLLHDVGSQGDLLQQVPWFGESLVDNERKSSVKLDISDDCKHLSDDKLCLDYSMDEAFNKMPYGGVVWDEEPLQDLGFCHYLLQQVAGSRESIDSEKATGVIEVATDKVLTHMGGLSHFLEICENSNTDEADHEREEIVLDDQLSSETLDGCNEKLQLEEVYVACLEMIPPCAGCVTDQFSPQYLNHQCRIHLCLSCCGAWFGQDMESDCKDSVIFYGKQEMCGSAHYMASGVAPWRRNALSQGNSDMKATCSIFNKILSWNRGGFSPGESELQLELCMMSARQWDPGIIIKWLRNIFELQSWNGDGLNDISNVVAAGHKLSFSTVTFVT